MKLLTVVRHDNGSHNMSAMDEISDLGREQALVLGKSFHDRGESAQMIWTGASNRQRDSAEIFAQAAGYSGPIRVLPELREFNYHNMFERCDPHYVRNINNSPNIRKAYAALLRQATERWSSGQHDRDYEETIQQFDERVHFAFNHIESQINDDEQHVVFTSSGVIAASLHLMLRLDVQAGIMLFLNLANMGVMRVRLASNGPQLLSYNDISHFMGKNRHLLTFQ